MHRAHHLGGRKIEASKNNNGATIVTKYFPKIAGMGITGIKI